MKCNRIEGNLDVELYQIFPQPRYSVFKKRQQIFYIEEGFNVQSIELIYYDEDTVGFVMEVFDEKRDPRRSYKYGPRGGYLESLPLYKALSEVNLQRNSSGSFFCQVIDIKSEPEIADFLTFYKILNNHYPLPEIVNLTIEKILNVEIGPHKPSTLVDICIEKLAINMSFVNSIMKGKKRSLPESFQQKIIARHQSLCGLPSDEKCI